MREDSGPKGWFITLWAAVALLKCALSARLPPFVDEVFYWQEGRHPAWAYSDLPGLTAWLTRLGTELGGETALGLRWPFLLIAAALPWLVVRITRREAGPRAAWQAGILSVLLPLAGTLGLLALPDVPLALATLLCLDAGTRLLRTVDRAAVVTLAAGLCLGALTHYRFVAVIGVGFLALLACAEGRRVLRDPRVWVALAAGAAAWLPLLLWNLDNADAGLRFQLLDRHPWSFHADGALFLPVQALLVTPLLFAGLVMAGWRARATDSPSPLRFLARSGLWVVAGFFALGFFADSERVSFHWPLPGYLALLPLAPAALATWPRALRIACIGLAALGLIAGLSYYAGVSSPALRARFAASKAYPANFAGWDTLAAEVRARRARMPPGTRLVADNFKLGAELGFALNDPEIPVLDHPLNHRHGRAPQLRLWGLHSRGREDWGDAPVLLVVGATDVEYKHLLARYHALCERVGPLPAPTVLNIDHGRQRFLLFALNGRAPAGAACTAPAMAWIDAPVSGARVGRRLELRGWAFKDGVGLRRVEVLLDGRPVGEARYGTDNPGVAAFWRISNDPQHPKVGFGTELDLAGHPAGRHWLGLRLHGRDGSVEDWPEQPLDLEAETP